MFYCQLYEVFISQLITVHTLSEKRREANVFKIIVVNHNFSDNQKNILPKQKLVTLINIDVEIHNFFFFLQIKYRNTFKKMIKRDLFPTPTPEGHTCNIWKYQAGG